MRQMVPRLEDGLIREQETGCQQFEPPSDGLPASEGMLSLGGVHQAVGLSNHGKPVKRRQGWLFEINGRAHAFTCGRSKIRVAGDAPTRILGNLSTLRQAAFPASVVADVLRV